MKLSDLTKKPATTDEAEQRLKDLQAEKEKLEGKISSLANEIETIKEEAGETSLQDALEGTSNSGTIRRKLWNKEKEREAKVQALEKIQVHIKKAEKEKILAQAKQKRDEAKKLEDEASEIEKQRDKLLKELYKVEGCEFVPFIRTHNPSVAYTQETMQKMNTPKSEMLSIHAQSLINEAEQLESQAQSTKQEKEAVS